MWLPSLVLGRPFQEVRWVRLKNKQEGQTAGLGPCFHLPIGQPILDFRFSEQPDKKHRSQGSENRYKMEPLRKPVEKGETHISRLRSETLCLPTAFSERRRQVPRPPEDLAAALAAMALLGARDDPAAARLTEAFRASRERAAAPGEVPARAGCGRGGQQRVGIPFWLVGEFATQILGPILVGIRMFTGGTIWVFTHGHVSDGLFAWWSKQPPGST